MKPRLRIVLLTLASFLGLAFGAPMPIRAQVYAVKDLGTLPGETNSIAYNLNDAGQVVGQSGLYGVLWSGGTMTELILPGGALSVAQGISPGGAVVGSSHALNDYTHAFLYTDNTVYDLHERLLGGTQNSSYANDINSWGQIVGGAFTPSDQYHAYIMDPLSGATYDLGTLGGYGSEADAINYRTEVAGYSNLPPGQRHAFFWDVHGMIDLGALGGYYAESGATDINDYSEVVGWSYRADGAQHAFSWVQGGRMADLGTLGGTTSAAQGINNYGLIVGSSTTASGQTHAFLYIPNPILANPGGGTGASASATAAGFSMIFFNYGIRDLNTWLPANSGWELTSAQAINNKGQIVGWGQHYGQTHAFLMTPIAVQSLTVAPATVAGGRTVFGTITLNEVTPTDITVSISNTNPAVTAPASVVIAAGTAGQTFALTTTPVASTTAGAITASYNGSQSAAITIRPPVMVSVKLLPNATHGGGTVAGGFTLDGPVAVNTKVLLGSSKPTVARPTVSSVLLAPGAKTGTFTVSTSAVLANNLVSISAAANGTTKSATLLVVP